MNHFQMDIMKIKELLNDIEPFILIDKVIKLDSNLILCEKYISYQEPCFRGHFKDYPIYPGTLILEIFIQSVILKLNINKNVQITRSELSFKGNIKFLNKVIPGCKLEISTTNILKNRYLCKAKSINKRISECVIELNL